MSKLASALGAIGALAIAQSAVAADIPERMPVKAPAAVVASSWTGCYIGGNGGGLWANKHWANESAGALVPGETITRQHPSSWLGGVQLGCNYQSGQFVFGVQGDYDWSDASKSTADQVAAGATDRSRIKSLASVTGRVGYTWDRMLGYVKGGAAWVRDHYDVFDSTSGALLASARETRTGWTVGVGAEYAFLRNWSAFIEYDYYDFGRRNIDFVDPAGGLFGTAGIRERINVVKVGVNYKFW